jgi:two-component system sensor kinase FixL
MAERLVSWFRPPLLQQETHLQAKDATGPGGGLVAGHIEAILECMVEGVVVIDRAGIMLRFNRAAERLFGYRVDEVLGRNVSLLMPPPWSREHDQYLARYSQTREGRIIGIGREVQGLRRDGSVFPMELSVGAFDAGDTPCFVGVIRDLSEARRMQVTLAAREAQLRLMFDQAPVGSFVLDERGQVTSCNVAFERMLGSEPRRLPGRNHRDLLHPDDRTTLEAALDALRQGQPGRARLARDLRYLRRDGSVAHVQLHVGLVDAVEGMRVLIGQCIDHSAEHQARAELAALHDQLAHVNRLSVMGEMASGIAHEINQPLTAIAAYAQACRRLMASGDDTRVRTPVDEDLADALEQIAGQAQRAGEVIRRLRGFVRRGESSRATTRLGEVLSGVVKLAEVDARSFDIRIQRDIAPALPAVLADAVQVQQVVLNLLRNAMEATPAPDPGHDAAERVVTLSAEALADGVRIAVLDRGHGPDAATVERLFTPFFTTKRTGMGLGLSICQSIVEAHGGRITYRPREGGGSCFEFTLPAAPAATAGPA